MRRRFILLLAVVVALFTIAPAVGAGNINGNFTAHLSGQEEVPARDTDATGQAIFKVTDGGESLSFKLIVANIDNVFAAHIHCGAEGVNGPVGVTLFAQPTDPISPSGILAQGSITAPDGGNACGWLDVGDVIDAIRSGNTYVNVHTNDGEDPPNTGPGDFPGGEVRGQLG